MAERYYGINLNNLTAGEYFGFHDHFKEYCQAVLYMFRIKDHFIFEDNLITTLKDEQEVQRLIEGGMQPMDAIKCSFPDRFVCFGRRKKKANDEYDVAWFDLWDDYEITQADAFYDLFFTYKLRQTDLLELDNLLNNFLQTYSDVKTDFVRFLRLTLRKHGKKLLQPEQLETINEWIAELERQPTVLGEAEAKTKGKLKRERDDKITCLNQEQTALFIYCLRESKIILKDELLNNKEAGRAFSVLTGYSADTIRQNLNKSEVVRLANSKNIDTVTKAVNNLLKFIEDQVKPEG